MPRYIALQDVKVRLKGKVDFDDFARDPNQMPTALALRLIDEAEGQVELDLSPRYLAPFQGPGGTFSELPDRPTKNILKTLCELKAVERILETDFGSGTIINGENYSKTIHDRYQSIVDNNILAKKGEEGKKDYMNWAYPPMPVLRLNYHNSAADDGYSGMVSWTTRGEGSFPLDNINDPQDSFWNALFVDAHDGPNPPWPNR